jgi:hypothetical protein
VNFEFRSLKEYDRRKIEFGSLKSEMLDVCYEERFT